MASAWEDCQRRLVGVRNGGYDVAMACEIFKLHCIGFSCLATAMGKNQNRTTFYRMCKRRALKCVSLHQACLNGIIRGPQVSFKALRALRLVKT